MTYFIRQVDWQEASEQLHVIRTEVFVKGQGVPRNVESDGTDHQCVHFIATSKDGQAIGTARVDRHGHIGRVAVLESHRGQGVGGRLMLGTIEYLRTTSHSSAILNSQESAISFYERLGFQQAGEPFVEAGILHVEMRLQLRPDVA